MKNSSKKIQVEIKIKLEIKVKTQRIKVKLLKLLMWHVLPAMVAFYAISYQETNFLGGMIAGAISIFVSGAVIRKFNRANRELARLHEIQDTVE